jgi:hypothetical protein
MCACGTLPRLRVAVRRKHPENGHETVDVFYMTTLLVVKKYFGQA